MSAPTVLLIGGSDSSGSAGITRDVTTLTDCGVVAAVAITAVTAQTDTHVTRIHHVPPEVLVAQIAAARATRNIAAIKIGMLGRSATLQAVVAALADAGLDNASCPWVLDPVLMSSSGTLLLEEAALGVLRSRLLPRVAVLTPNLPEAAALLQTTVASDEPSMLEQARALLELGPAAVLIKGGHGCGAEAVDLLMMRGGRVERLSTARLRTTLRGTGCMLASAIAARLAEQQPLLDACLYAKRYLTEQLSKTLP
jgi:hydroxymethylpyrimidine/phosphomethylpyrimidine kinase